MEAELDIILQRSEIMAYTKAQVAALLNGGLANGEISVSAIGAGEGGSAQSQHQAAVQFWTIALALKGNQALTSDQRVMAQAELAKHQRAIEAITNPPRGRERVNAV
jgi:hypothetical protein